MRFDRRMNTALLAIPRFCSHARSERRLRGRIGAGIGALLARHTKELVYSGQMIVLGQGREADEAWFLLLTVRGCLG